MKQTDFWANIRDNSSDKDKIFNVKEAFYNALNISEYHKHLPNQNSEAMDDVVDIGVWALDYAKQLEKEIDELKKEGKSN